MTARVIWTGLPYESCKKSMRVVEDEAHDIQVEEEDGADALGAMRWVSIMAPDDDAYHSVEAALRHLLEERR